MKQTLKTSQVQNWSLFGLKPMHRALVRRSVTQFNSSLNSSVAPRIAWHVDDLSNPDGTNAVAMLRRVGVLVIDRDALIRRVEQDNGSDSFVKELHNRNTEQIRLLWHWAWQGKKNLLWCTEGTFDGVIHDASTMRSWLSVSFEKGNKIEIQQNGLLHGIELPRLGSLSTNAS